MTKICIIGDSHIGALQLGWRAISSEFPEIEVTAFGAPKGLFAELEVSEDQLVPSGEKAREYFRRVSGGQHTIDGSYDRYLICGIHWAMRLLLPTLDKFRREDQAPSHRIPLSNEGYATMMRGLLRNSLSTSTLVKLRQITAKPVDMIAAPMPSEAAPAGVYARLKDSGEAQMVASQFEAAAETVAAEHGAGFLKQPRETLSNPLQTLLRYKVGSVRTFRGNLDMPHDDDDYQHMNAEYGALVLRGALRK